MRRRPTLVRGVVAISPRAITIDLLRTAASATPNIWTSQQRTVQRPGHRSRHAPNRRAIRRAERDRAADPTLSEKPTVMHRALKLNVTLARVKGHADIAALITLSHRRVVQEPANGTGHRHVDLAR